MRLHFYCSTTKLWKVMILLVSVYLSLCLFTEGSSCDHYPWCHWLVTDHMTLSPCYNWFTWRSHVPQAPRQCFHYAAQISICKRVVSIPLKCLRVTSRNSSWGKVMFSQVYVSHSVHTGYGPGGKGGMAPGMVYPQYWHLVVATEAGGTHATEMHSCKLLHIPLQLHLLEYSD